MSPKLENTHKLLQTPHTADGRIMFHPILMMHASHTCEQTYEQFMRDHRNLVEANLRCLELYDHDAVSVISDPYRETAAFGANVCFDGNNSPRADKVVKCAEDIDRLAIPDVYRNERTLDRINGVKLFRERLGAKFPVIGWVEGPLAEAADLMGMEEVLMEMMLNGDNIHRLCDKTLQVAKDFARAQIEAGAQVIGVGDAICSQIPPELYREFVFDRHKELFEYIHKCGAIVKLHICGDIKHLLDDIACENVDILDLDHMMDLADTYKIMGEDVILSGNLDPVSVIMKGDKELIRQKFEQAKTAIPPQNWILMGGCEIPMYTPAENVIYMRQISK